MGEEKRLRAELEQTRTQVSELQEVVSGSFARLKDGSYEDSEAERLVQTVIAVSASCCLEESLALSLPTALAKRERGAFDEAVIGQAEQSFQGKLDSLRDIVEAAEGPLAVQVSASQTAQAELDAAMDDQAQAVDVEASKVEELLSTRADHVAAVQQSENADAQARQIVEEHSKLLPQA